VSEVYARDRPNSFSFSEPNNVFFNFRPFIFLPKKMHIFSVYFIFRYKYGRKKNTETVNAFSMCGQSAPHCLGGGCEAKAINTGDGYGTYGNPRCQVLNFTGSPRGGGTHTANWQREVMLREDSISESTVCVPLCGLIIH